MPWRNQLITFLIKGGTTGRPQVNIMQSTARYANSKQVLAYLNALQAEGKVQKFKVPAARGLDATVWRATNKILTESQ